MLVSGFKVLGLWVYRVRGLWRLGHLEFKAGVGANGLGFRV